MNNHEVEGRSSVARSEVARVGALAREHADASERGRTLAPEVVAALRETKLLGVAAPRAAGGEELGLVDLLELFEAMAAHDTSAGWCFMITSLLTAVAGAYLDDDATRAIFSKGAPACAGLISPNGLARPVDGGFEVSGRWGFGSGVRHADWIVTSAVVEGAPPMGPGLPPPMLTVVVPASEVRVESTWDTAGLRGSGSEHYTIEGVFVPSSFTCSFPFAPARRGHARFDLPILAFLAPGHLGFALGAAKGALASIVEAAPKRVKTWTRTALASSEAFRMELGRNVAKLGAARAYAFEAMRLAEARASSGAPLSLADWSTLRLAVTFVTEVAAEVCAFAFRAGGASALYLASPLQRFSRDLAAAGQHVAATDDAYLFAAEVLLDCAAPHPLMLPRLPRA